MDNSFHKVKISLNWLFFGALIVCIACNSNFVPKPRGYFKIELPEKRYQVFNQPGYPYTFEYPLYARIIKDSTFLVMLPKTRGG